jgi:hypothetical protein
MKSEIFSIALEFEPQVHESLVTNAICNIEKNKK